MLSIQGDTDTKILEVKRSLRKRFQIIANEAKIIFPFSHWPIPVFKKYIQIDDNKISILPVVPAIDILSPAPVIDKPHFLTVFHLDSWNRKNMIGMLDALKIVQKTISNIHLDIYGGGSVKSTNIIKKMIEDYGLKDSVSLLGASPNGDLPNVMKKYAGFILPSKRESYGLVYVEALFSGLPVLLSKDRGIDGFFEIDKIGYACDPFDKNDIAKGMQHILTHQSDLKSSIFQMQKNGRLDIVCPKPILNIYRDGINRVLATS
jgi:glycosyltransferase involved in cell wall biosynthesis